jgi:hypothetical protein
LVWLDCSLEDEEPPADVPDELDLLELPHAARSAAANPPATTTDDILLLFKR